MSPDWSSKWIPRKVVLRNKHELVSIVFSRIRAPRRAPFRGNLLAISGSVDWSGNGIPHSIHETSGRPADLRRYLGGAISNSTDTTTAVMDSNTAQSADVALVHQIDTDCGDSLLDGIGLVVAAVISAARPAED